MPTATAGRSSQRIRNAQGHHIESHFSGAVPRVWPSNRYRTLYRSFGIRMPGCDVSTGGELLAEACLNAVHAGCREHPGDAPTRGFVRDSNLRFEMRRGWRSLPTSSHEKRRGSRHGHLARPASACSTRAAAGSRRGASGAGKLGSSSWDRETGRGETEPRSRVVVFFRRIRIWLSTRGSQGSIG